MENLDHNDYCKVIGQLYLDSYLKVQAHHSQSTQLIQSLKSQLEEAKRINAELRRSSSIKKEA